MGDLILLRVLNRALNHLEEWLIAALIAAATGLIFIAVVHRYGAGESIDFSRWAAAHGLTWLATLSMAVFTFLSELDLSWKLALTLLPLLLGAIISVGFLRLEASRFHVSGVSPSYIMAVALLFGLYASLMATEVWQKSARMSFNFGGALFAADHTNKELFGNSGSQARADVNYRYTSKMTIGAYYSFNDYTFTHHIQISNAHTVGGIFSYAVTRTAQVRLRAGITQAESEGLTSVPLATQIGLDVLKKGGTAVDAAIAANAALGLMEPVSNGVGGDLFAIVWDAKTKKLYGYNGSGRSPKALTLQYFVDHGLSEIPALGPLPVNVPGTVDAWFALHDRFGKLPMRDDLAPAIGYAREGFPVTELIAYYWKLSAPRLSKFPGFKEQMTIAGRAPEKGEIWKNPNLANTLQTIADGGRDAFYKGKIAHVSGDYFKANGGFLS